jgi:hypothetical protein
LFDDVPEAVSHHIREHEVGEDWHGTMKTLVDELSKARDARLADTGDRARHPVAINPDHYRRIS